MSCRPFSIVLAIAYIVVAVAGEYELPSEVKTCKRGTDDYSSCLRLAIQESWPVNFPTLDPYYVDHNEAEFGNGELHGKIEEWDVYVYGMKNAKFLAVRPEYSDDFFKLEIDLAFPKIFIEGEYKADGNLASFKIGGKGHFNVSTEDIKITWTISGPVKNDRWMVEHYLPNVQIGKMKVWCSDLFNGNEELTKTVLEFVNEYWPTIYRGMYPYIADVWDKLFTELVNRFFSQVSFNKLFPSA
ncbi:hypothetical protein KPH14_005268 [Odynerus spinipes]|uniref:Circadian clock-controlled protein n=1 Tax=Odynerus spinipes TaxID=1348599 RepID=A0AAD9RBC1_9HYME|nr:hypothetical protein KPH14_005268 [Odynerus spinipes]